MLVPFFVLAVFVYRVVVIVGLRIGLQVQLLSRLEAQWAS